MVIGVCGYSFSGSGAVVDFLKQWGKIDVLDSFEFSLVYAPDGLNDLKYHLCDNFSKYLTSAVAIERFRRFFYRTFINNKGNRKIRQKLKSALDDYIDSLIDVSWTGYGGSDIYLYSGFFYKNRRLDMMLYKIHSHLISKLPFRNKKKHLPYHKIEISIEPRLFMEKTKKFIRTILQELGFAKEVVVIDQAFSPNFPNNSLSFFDNARGIIVDRDPRDLYVLAKKYLHPKGLGTQIPTDDVNDFIKYFQKTRTNGDKCNNDRLIKIQFEDLIYKYDETKEKIRSFCNLDFEFNEFSFFDPHLSANNTLLFLQDSTFLEETKIIEKELSDYLYDFSNCNSYERKGKMFLDKPNE